MTVEYRYERFSRELLQEDQHHFGGRGAPGTPLPDFDLVTTEGTRVRRSEFIGRRPLLLSFASVTCPMSASAAPVLKRLHAELGDDVYFLTVYVREAHPGERYPQPLTLTEKLEHAWDYEDREEIPWPVAVDGLDGSLHRALDAKPSSAYLVGQDGTIVFRSLWSNDEGALRAGLRGYLREGRMQERERRVVPLLRGLGAMYATLERAGPRARDDLAREAPVVWALARVAHAFGPLPPLGRGLAAVATAAAGAGLVVAGSAWLVRRALRPRDC